MISLPKIEKTISALAREKSKPLQHHLVGVEKESLRVASDGTLAKTAHPQALGSALTHPYITTDFSEALLEFVTPPQVDSAQAIEFLEDIHRYVYANIGDELLWCASMPCVVRGDTDIPLAYYGSSNIGRMKTIYRKGLGYRYGRFMQVISGVHFNYSLGEPFWEWYSRYLGNTESMQYFRSEHYMGLIRNFLRLAWTIPYLFGTSPAICKTFAASDAHNLERFDDSTLFAPYATSLRMGDIGYQNNQEAKIGVKACYDNVAQYVLSLWRAVTTEYAPYKSIGVKKDGEHLQLNVNILQIENEYYTTMRPKPQSIGNDMPLAVLKQKGVQYVELRSLDVDIFENTGVSTKQFCFIEALMLFCLFNDSPLIQTNQWQMIDGNEIKVAHEGRRPDLELNDLGKNRKLKEWGIELCEQMRSVCGLLDEQCATTVYGLALQEQIEKFQNPEMCPSALLLEEMRENQESFVDLVQRYAIKKKNYFMQDTMDEKRLKQFEKITQESIIKQERLETADDLSLDEYIASYYAQLGDLI